MQPEQRAGPRRLPLVLNSSRFALVGHHDTKLGVMSTHLLVGPILLHDGQLTCHIRVDEPKHGTQVLEKPVKMEAQWKGCPSLVCNKTTDFISKMLFSDSNDLQH